MKDTDLGDDLISGAEAIAIFIWGHRKFKRRVYYFADRGELPIFRVGARFHARRSTLRAFIAKREAQAAECAAPHAA
jgi:hypothetical protein